jgi:hypothetical protein
MFKYFFIKKCVVYEIMWNIVVQPDRHGTHDNITRHMHFACWLDKTHAQIL